MYPGDRQSGEGLARRAVWRVGSAFGALAVLLAAVGFYYWFIARVEVGTDEILILVNKTGRDVPAGLKDDDLLSQVVLYPELVKAIAAHTGESEEEVRSGYKGIRYEVLKAGRYFPNPYFYRRIVTKTTVIEQNEIGVKVCKFGKPLPFPKTVATAPDERGPWHEILKPGRHDINPLAYEVLRFPLIEIPPGHVGVVTLLSGDDPTVKNTYTVGPGEKGVQQETLPPGLVYENPYLKKVDIVDVRNQKYDMRDADAIQFPSNDSFTITMEGTITWAIMPDRVAEVTVAYGDQQDILDKIIMPNARSIARIQGSKLPAREFIGGQTRKAFQDKLLAALQRDCRAQGIDIKDALVRAIHPPPEIASLISQREQAAQEIERSTNQMAEARSEALLVEQKEVQAQNAAVGDARREVVTVVMEAEQGKVVSVTQARREHEVAKLRLEAAEKEAAAIRSRGQADAHVVLLEYQAEAEPLKAAVEAFGDGHTYAQQFFLRKIAPAITSILSNTEGPFAEIFKQFQAFPAAGAQSGGGE
ncbi:MAG: hypothetical protein C4547_16220 [Phycisphaerales bacterium]|nr:MAG: hypothetical protein C4547_16220 [Phycisphaerales bacterium]